MPDGTTVGHGVAFLAGLASFLSPCVLPLVPVNIAIISGVSVESLAAGQRSAFWPTLSRTFMFIAGFSTVFTLMGAGFGSVGALLHEYARVIQFAGGVVVMIFGLHLTGLLPITYLYRQGRGFSWGAGRFGIAGTYVMGVAFAVAWQPCVGPILGAILAYAASEGQSGRGATLLLAYSAGLGMPFMIAAAGMGWFMKTSQRLRKHLNRIEVGSGVLLLIIGLLLITNKLALLARLAAGLASPAG